MARLTLLIVILLVLELILVADVKGLSFIKTPVVQTIQAVQKIPSDLTQTEAEKDKILAQNTPGTPLELIIPSLEIDAKIEQVGLDKDGGMDVPKDPKDTAWYMKGPKPGEIGQSVIDGHLDTVTGAPAVFFRLSKLNISDVVQVKDDKGHLYSFKVVDKKVYPYNHFPSDLVFGISTKKMLNLITCHGYWETNVDTYSDRIVIFTELIQS